MWGKTSVGGLVEERLFTKNKFKDFEHTFVTQDRFFTIQISCFRLNKVLSVDFSYFILLFEMNFYHTPTELKSKDIRST